jgi:hypothetical protein
MRTITRTLGALAAATIAATTLAIPAQASTPLTKSCTVDGLRLTVTRVSGGRLHTTASAGKNVNVAWGPDQHWDLERVTYYGWTSTAVSHSTSAYFTERARVSGGHQSVRVTYGRHSGYLPIPAVGCTITLQ